MIRIYLLLLVFLLLSCQKDKTVYIPKDYSDYHKRAKKFCQNNGYNQDFYLLIDLGIHSGRKRFFVYDFKDKKVTKSYLVSHGCGNSVWSMDFTKDNPMISNRDGSHASSVGKFAVHTRGYSQWGIKVKYLMSGLEDTNANAMARTIVFHGWDAIKDKEVYPSGTPEGWGCPAVSNKTMREMDEKLKNRSDKTLMWIIKK